MVERRRGAFGALNFSEQSRESAVLRATTDLFVNGEKQGAEEARRYEELASHFLPKVSLTDRAFVAELLADCPSAPPSVLRLLAKDALEVAAPVLKRSAALSSLDLLVIIAATGPMHHRLIAARSGLNADVAKALLMTGDAESAALVDTKMPGAAREIRLALSSQARSSAPPAPPATAGQLPGDPSSISQFLSMARQDRLRWLGRLSDRGARAPIRPEARAIEAKLRTAFHTSQIVGFARKGQREELVGAVADSLGLDRFSVQRMIVDPSGEALVVLIKAMGLNDADARQILLLANPNIGLNVEAFFRLADLHGAMELAVAEALVAAWRGERPVLRIGHQSHFSDEAGARPAGRAAERPSQGDAGERRREG